MSKPGDTGSTCALVPATATAPSAALNVITFTLDRGQFGTWTLEAEIDVQDAGAPVVNTAQRFTFTSPAGTIAYACTVIEARAHVGRGTVFAVGGAGGLRSMVPALDYGEVRARIVVEDLLRDAQLRDAMGAPVLVNGAVVSELGDAASLAALDALPHLARWSRPAGTASSALTRIAAKLSELTGNAYGWRVKPNGAVWIGVETWPAYVSTTAPKDPPYYTEEPDARGMGTIALDAPDLDPGSTVAAPEDQGGAPKGTATVRVSSVRYTVDDESRFRARVMVAEPTPGPRGREQDIRRRWVEGALPPQALRVPWFATVVSQDADGALGLRLESAAPVMTCSSVPYWPGLPGYRVAVPMGSQCLVVFVGGREDTPVVTNWGPDTTFTLLTVGDAFGDGATVNTPGNTQPIARKGDAVECGTLAGIAPPGGGPVVFTFTQAGYSPLVATVVDVAGSVTSGAPYFKGGAP